MFPQPCPLITSLSPACLKYRSPSVNLSSLNLGVQIPSPPLLDPGIQTLNHAPSERPTLTSAFCLRPRNLDPSLQHPDLGFHINPFSLRSRGLDSHILGNSDLSFSSPRLMGASTIPPLSDPKVDTLALCPQNPALLPRPKSHSTHGTWEQRLLGTLGHSISLCSTTCLTLAGPGGFTLPLSSCPWCQALSPAPWSRKLRFREQRRPTRGQREPGPCQAWVTHSPDVGSAQVSTTTTAGY